MTPTDPLDAYIDAVSAALDLPIEAAWRDAVRANLKVTLAMGRHVEAFELPDSAEPAPVFSA
ncbi:MAG: hypothetical protein JWQ51_2049 [Tardiphaga sp.]|nr:hypothetical protein [Tardiphaga sp.]